MSVRIGGWTGSPDEFIELVRGHGTLTATANALGVHRSVPGKVAERLWGRGGGRVALGLVPPPDRATDAAGAATGPVAGTPRTPWGLGGPGTLVLPPKVGDYTGIGIFDLHGEWREERLFEAQLRHIHDVQPDFVVLGGDTTNYDIISRWQDKILKRMTPVAILREIRREIDDAKRVRDRVREAVGSGILIEVEGNHDDRLRKYLSDDLQEGWETAKEWQGVDDVLDGYYTRAGVFIRDRFLVRHGDTTAMYPAKKEYSMTNCSGWTGHLHNAHQHYEKPFPLTGERYTHTIAPCSCRTDANYGSGNAGIMRWHQGNLIGTFNAQNHQDHTTDIGLWNGETLLVRGERY